MTTLGPQAQEALTEKPVAPGEHPLPGRRADVELETIEWNFDVASPHAEGAMRLVVVDGIRRHIGKASFCYGEWVGSSASFRPGEDVIAWAEMPKGPDPARQQLADIRAAAEEYGRALRARENGNTAGYRLTDTVLAVLGFDWRTGKFTPRTGDPQ
jgi:hypothetical protein